MEWRLLVESQSASPGAAVGEDEALLMHVQAPVLRVWVNDPCLVLGRQDAHLPHLARAIREAAGRHLPLIQRTSGGSCVWQGPGVYNVSIIAPASAAPAGVHATFQALGYGMLEALRRLGLDGCFGHVAGAYCDGPHNLVVEGCKVAGLAQVRRKVGALVHASVLVSLDLDMMHEHIERFYRDAGKPQRFNRAGTATLSRLAGRTLCFESFVEAMVSAYASQGRTMRQDRLSTEEALWLNEQAGRYQLSAAA